MTDREEAPAYRGPATSAPDELDVPAPDGITLETIDCHGEQWLVISFPLPKPCWPKALTPAERAVASLLLEGLPNARIAEARGTSVRTVVNQVASIYRKARVASRVELAARVFAGARD